MSTNQQTAFALVRTISYAPESIRPSRPAELSRPAWIVCRNRRQHPLADDEGLLRWTEQGHVLPDDYVVSTRLDRCVQARDILELDAIFRTATVRRLETIARTMVVLGLLTVCVEAVLGILMLVAAITAGVLAIETGAVSHGNAMTSEVEG